MTGCNKCGGRLIKDLITYKEMYLDHPIIIEKVAGEKCTHCGAEFVDESVKDGLNKKVLEGKLEIVRELPMKPVLISKVKKVRDEKGISQGVISKALGFSMQRYGAIERNNTTPTVYTAMQVTKLLDVDINEMYQLEYIHEKLYDIILERSTNAKENVRQIKSEWNLLQEKWKELNSKYKNITKNNSEPELIAEIEQELKEIKQNKKVLKDQIEEESKNIIFSNIQDNKDDGVNSEKAKDSEGKAKGTAYCIIYDDWIRIQKEYSEYFIKTT